MANLPRQLDGVLARFIRAEVRRGLTGNWYWLLLAGSTFFLRRVLNDRKIVVSNVTVSPGEQLVIAVRDRKADRNNGKAENKSRKAQSKARKNESKNGKAETKARKSERKNGKAEREPRQVEVVEIKADKVENGKAESKALTAIDA